MGFSPTNEQNQEEKIHVSTSTTLNESNYVAVNTSQTSPVVKQKEYDGDFIDSSEFLGDNSLFVKYEFIEDENQTFDSTSSEAPESIEESFQTPSDINASAGRDYNLEYVDNFLTLTQQNLTPQGYTDFINSLPNQIRALFLYQTEFVKELKNITASDLIKSLKTQATMNVNYFKLVKVEILEGYEMSSDRQHMINNPKFRLLKKSDLETLSGLTLCRITRFYNNNLKIKRDLLSFPIQSQYFFIRSPQAVGNDVVDINYTEKAKKITMQHFVSKDYDAAGITSNIIVQPQGTSYTRPNDGSGGIIQTETTTTTTQAPQVTATTQTNTGGGY